MDYILNSGAYESSSSHQSQKNSDAIDFADFDELISDDDNKDGDNEEDGNEDDFDNILSEMSLGPLAGVPFLPKAPSKSVPSSGTIRKPMQNGRLHLTDFLVQHDVKPMFWEIQQQIQTWKAPKRGRQTFILEDETIDREEFDDAFRFHSVQTESASASKKMDVENADYNVIYPTSTLPLDFLKKQLSRKNLNQKQSVPQAAMHDRLEIESRLEQEIDRKLASVKMSMESTATSFHPVNLVSWENRVIWEPAPVGDRDLMNDDFLDPLSKLHPYFPGDEEEDYADEIIWDQDMLADKGFRLPFIPEEDSMLILESIDGTDGLLSDENRRIEETISRRKNRRKRENVDGLNDNTHNNDNNDPGGATGSNALFVTGLDPLNISNDKFYQEKEGEKSIRSVKVAPGATALRHSALALKIQAPYFKPMPSIVELRNFHRPSLCFRVGRKYGFRDLKDIAVPVKDGWSHDNMLDRKVTSHRELSAKDKSPLFLFEYCEERPPIMQNAGMDSLIKNFYRKRNDKDDHIPECSEGVPAILEASEKSPFSGFGDVEPGDTLPVIYNNLFQAPLFPHEHPSNDFVCIRNIYEGKESFYLKNINKLYVVGQTYPRIEVPGPNSRKANLFLKTMVLSTAFKSLEDPVSSAETPRIHLQSYIRKFPGISESALKKRLKDIADTDRRDDFSYYQLKRDAQVPTEQITPEQVCLNESMLSAQQYFHDNDYTLDNYDEDDDGENAADCEIELEIAPWKWTKNYLAAADYNTVLELIGQGDPTGCGEGFNFMKKPNRNRNRRIVPDAAYFQKCLEIWKAQCQSLRSSNMNLKRKNTSMLNQNEEDFYSTGRNVTSNVRTSLADQMDEDIDFDSPESKASKVLKIRRTFVDESGKKTEKIVTVKDPKVIQEYLYLREAQGFRPKRSRPKNVLTAEQEMEKRERRRIMEQQRRLQKRIEAREKAGLAVDSEPMPSLSQNSNSTKIGKKASELVCSACQQIGHIRTNKTCPMYEITMSNRRVSVKAEDSLAVENASSPSTSSKPLKRNADTQSDGADASGSKKGGNKKRKLSVDTVPSEPCKPSSSRRKTPRSELCDILENVRKQLEDHPESLPFHYPVNSKVVKDYYKIIKKPIDLDQIRKKARDHKYASATEFLADLELMAHNAILYNGEEHPIAVTGRNLLDIAQTMVSEKTEQILSLESQMIYRRAMVSSSTLSQYTKNLACIPDVSMEHIAPVGTLLDEM